MPSTPAKLRDQAIGLSPPLLDPKWRKFARSGATEARMVPSQ
ncbi:MAG TPA: hypothetical protein VGD52_26330 [Pseudoduganella sp.]